MHPRLLRTLAHIQQHFESRRIEVVSGYRVPERREELNSYHQVGRAVDIYLDGVSKEDLFQYCRSLERVGCGYYPEARFVHVDVRHSEYNPGGILDASSFSFPYEDESFDVVFATSILTHLLPDAVENYLAEIHRVLAPGGRSFVTYFLVDKESRSLLSKSEFPFQAIGGGAWAILPEQPEEAVAYEEPYILGLYEELRLEGAPRVFHGDWSGREGDIAGQDVIVGTRPAR